MQMSLNLIEKRSKIIGNERFGSGFLHAIHKLIRPGSRKTLRIGSELLNSLMKFKILIGTCFFIRNKVMSPVLKTDYTDHDPNNGAAFYF